MLHALLVMINDPKVLAVILGACGTGLNSLAIQKHWSDTAKNFSAGVMALFLAGVTGCAEGKFTGSLTDVGVLLTYGAYAFTTAHGLYVSIEALFPNAKPLTALQEATTLKKTTTVS